MISFKNIYKKVLFVSALGALTACSDMLDTKPQGQFTVEQIDENRVEGLIASAYAGLEAHFFGNNEAFAGPSTNWIFDVRSDDAYKGGGGTGMEENIHLLEVSEINSDNVSCLNKWQNNFYAISRVHNAMRAMQMSENTNFTSQIAEMKVLRAWYYFDLIRVFKSVPYFTENDNPNTTPNEDPTVARPAIIAAIKNDLQEAIPMLDGKKSKEGRITMTTAQAILAKVCAYDSDWEGVRENCEAIINSNQYSLFKNFGHMSQIAYNNGSESIFALQTSTANDNAHINWCNLLNCTYSEGNLYGTGDDFFYGSQNLVNAFRTDENGLPYLDGSFNKVIVDENYDGNIDPRVDFTVGRIGYPWRGYTYNEAWCRAIDIYGQFSNKKAWPAPEDALAAWPWGCNSLNYMFIRYADILLLEAEALIETSTGANAQVDENLRKSLDLINQIRQRAKDTAEDPESDKDLDPFKASYVVELYPTHYDGLLAWTKNRATLALRMERRLELALEGNRWFDLVRWGNDYLVKTMNTYMQEESALRQYYSGRSVTTDEIFLPVPLSEIDNSNGLYKQW